MADITSAFEFFFYWFGRVWSILDVSIGFVFFGHIVSLGDLIISVFIFSCIVAFFVKGSRN